MRRGESSLYTDPEGASAGAGGGAAALSGAPGAHADGQGAPASSAPPAAFGSRDDGATGEGGAAGGAPPRGDDFTRPAAAVFAAGHIARAVLPEGYRYAAFALALCGLGLLFSRYLALWLLSKDER
jgi:hypothetical protein